MSLSSQIENKAGEKSAASKGPTALYSDNKFPSNHLNELFRRLQQQSKDRGFRLLDAHLRESTLVLQEEVSKLPHYIRSQVPHFDNIATLSENGYLRHLGLGPAIETALLIVLQLGLFIRRHEALDKELDLLDNVTTVAGLSLGLFPRAAVAQSTTVAEVVNNGARCLRVSFRLGVFVSGFSQRPEAPQPDDFQQILAHAVTSITEESLRSELTRVNEELENPERSTSRPAKSIISYGEAAATPPLVPEPSSSDPCFQSRVAPGIDNDSPIRYKERLYSRTSNKTLIRHYLEALGPLTGPTADAFDESAAKGTLCALGQMMSCRATACLGGLLATSGRARRTSKHNRHLLLIELQCVPDAIDVEAIPSPMIKSPSQVRE